MPNVYMPSCALVFSIFLLIIYFSKRRINLLENKLYAIMLIVIALDSLLSTMTFFNIYTNYTKFFVEICSKLDYIMLLTWISCLFLYTFTISYKENRTFKRDFKILTIIVVLTNIIVSIWQIFSSFEIELINDIKQKVSGNAITITYLTWGIFMVLTSAILFSNLKNISKKYIPIFVCIMFSIILFLMLSINPHLVIISIVLAFINLIMFFTIENPDLSNLEEVNLLKLQAESANRVKDQIIKEIGHEIKTPLNHAIGYNSLNMDSSDAEVRENSAIIEKSLHQVNDIAMNTIRYADIISGNFTLNNKSYSISKLLSQVNQIPERIIDKTKVKYICNIDKNIPRIVDGDFDSVYLIFKELLTNACKYTKEGTITLDVKTSTKNNNCTLTIKVKDTGIGIRKKDLPDLFNCLQKIDFETNQSFARGIGLGLALCSKLVEKMNGTIKVKSEFGKGSEFTVKINQYTLEGVTKTKK